MMYSMCVYRDNKHVLVLSLGLNGGEEKVSNSERKASVYESKGIQIRIFYLVHNNAKITDEKKAASLDYLIFFATTDA